MRQRIVSFGRVFGYEAGMSSRSALYFAAGLLAFASSAAIVIGIAPSKSFSDSVSPPCWPPAPN